MVPENQLGLGLLLVAIGIALGLAAWAGKGPQKVTIIGIEFGGSGAGLSRNARITLACVGTLVGVIGLALTVAGFGGPRPPEPTPPPTPAAPLASPVPQAEVPDVILLPLDEALGELDNQGLQADVRCMETDEDVPAGLVYDTDPPSGATVPKLSTVSVFVQPPCP